MEKPQIEIHIESNIDDVIKKVKELVSLLERANQLIQSLKSIL